MSKRIGMLIIVLAAILGGFVIMSPKPALAGSFNAPVLMVHGINAQSTINCNWHPEFGTVRDYFSSQGYWDNATVGYYNADTNCDYNAQSESYHCTGWFDSGSSDGTVNENIYHTSCLLAWFIWDHYTAQNNTTIAVIAHSLGGIIIRQAIFDTPYVGAFPPYLLISDVATAGTPHQGLAGVAAGGYEIRYGCPNPCEEAYQMQFNSSLMSSLNSTSFRGGFGRDPKAPDWGNTDWTTMSSDNDTTLGWACYAFPDSLGAPNGVTVGSCGLMPGATHFVIYPGPYPSYDHGDYLEDNNTTWNADEEYSDTNGGTWVNTSVSQHSIFTLYMAILYSDW